MFKLDSFAALHLLRISGFVAPDVVGMCPTATARGDVDDARMGMEDVGMSDNCLVEMVYGAAECERLE